MENTFDIAYRSYKEWTFEQCARMLDALRKRVSDEQDSALRASGLLNRDRIFQPVDEEQFQRELMDAQQAYKHGDFQDALDFCEAMERRL